jgi:hypothetical protein
MISRKPKKDDLAALLGPEVRARVQTAAATLWSVADDGFAVVMHEGEAQELPGTSRPIHVALPWLSLTLGRFLAPARSTRDRAGVEFLLVGDSNAVPPEDRRDAALVAREVQVFEQCLRETARLLSLPKAADPALLSALASVSCVRELRLPDPADRGCVHLCNGTLRITGWGLCHNPWKVADLLARDGSATPEAHEYLKRLGQTMRDKLKVAEDEPRDWRSDYRTPGLGNPRHRTATALTWWMWVGIIAAGAFLIWILSWVLP